MQDVHCIRMKTYSLTHPSLILLQISISIIDTNNKNPQIELTEFETTIRMYENATEEDYVGKVIASDLDRDAPHNVLEYTFNYQLNPNLQRFFTIDAMTGELVLGPTQLDRDEGLATHDIYINVQDNYQGNGARLRNETMIQLIVLDVNNKEPELPSADSLNFSANENDLIVSLNYLTKRFHVYSPPT